MHRIVISLPVVTLLLFAPAALAQQAPSYALRVTCQWGNQQCTPEGVMIAGGATASVAVTGVPGATVTVHVNTHERGGILAFPGVPVQGGTVALTFFKSRYLFPPYKTRSAGKNILRGMGIGRRPADAAAAPLQVVLDGLSQTVDISITSGAVSQNIPLLVRWRPWSVETGGFYAYSWAHDEKLVTETFSIDADGEGPNAPESRTRVVALREGDNIGPSTGVTFFFHPGNYPNVGFEFGTAANGNNPSSWFLGLGIRLLQPTDSSLLTIAAGISRVTVTSYPGIESGKDYATTDPLLTGSTHYTNRPYVSIGLGISFGGTGGTQTP
jgi:hypothetical protein